VSEVHVDGNGDAQRVPRGFFDEEDDGARDKALDILRGSMVDEDEDDEESLSDHYAICMALVDNARSRGFPPSIFGPLWEFLDGLITAGIMGKEFNKFRNMHGHVVAFIPVTFWREIEDKYFEGVVEDPRFWLCHEHMEWYAPFGREIQSAALMW
jgi:hypothetical protein